MAEVYKRSTRCKKVNYKEAQTENDDNDDEDFELETNYRKTPNRRSRSKLTNGKTENRPSIKPAENVQSSTNDKIPTVYSKPSIEYGSNCPNLSEDESSESSEDESLATIKATQQRLKMRNKMLCKIDKNVASNNEKKQNTSRIDNGNHDNIYKKNNTPPKVQTQIDVSDNSEMHLKETATNKITIEFPDDSKLINAKDLKQKIDLKKRKASTTEPQQATTKRKRKKKNEEVHITKCSTSLENEEIKKTVHKKSGLINFVAEEMDISDTVHAMNESSSDENEWQEVEEVQIKSPKKKKKKSKANAKPAKQEPVVKDVQISVGVVSIHNKKKRTSRHEKMFIWLRQLAGRFLKERKLLLHKCHLLCLLAKHLNESEICNNKNNQGVFLSLIPREYTEISSFKNKWGIPKVTHFLNWFQKEIPSVRELLLYVAQEADEVKDLDRVHVLVIMLRSLGFLTRLIISLQPVSYKIKEPNNTKDKSKNDLKSSSTSTKTKAISKQTEFTSPYFTKTKTKTPPSTKRRITEENKETEKKSQEKKIIKTSSTRAVPKKYGSREKKRLNYNEETSVDHDTGVVTPARKKKTRVNNKDGGSDDDFEPDKSLEATPFSRKRSATRKASVSLTGECSNNSQTKLSRNNSTGIDIWCELYLESMQSWICIELTTSAINKPHKCEELATRPLQYVVGIDNDQKIKDVTCRYAEKWLSVNRKLRADREWWSATLDPFKPNKSIIDSTEDAQLKKYLLQQDFPKSISEFKDHPLYALQRHLLKYEAIYPETAVPLGYIRNEAIYSRECIHELHTRETWMKQARTVKQGQIPYKLVKGRPKRHTPEYEKDNIKLEVFGLWQTEIYVPPPVKDGKVPKNEYGNVELFRPSMLPEGAVHLPMNNILKIARKLDIDCAQAMMGWDFHCGWAHPVFEGIVVAKEFEDLLLDAWRQDEEKVREKEKEKREKAIYGNWKKLIKGILIRHKLKTKYNFDDDEIEQQSAAENPKATTSTATKKARTKSSNKQNSGKEKIAATKKNKVSKTKINDEYIDLSVSWPQNRMDGATSLADDGHVHVFDRTEQRGSETVQKCSCGLLLPVDNLESL